MQINWNFVAVVGVVILCLLIVIVIYVCNNNRRASNRSLQVGGRGSNIW